MHHTTISNILKENDIEKRTISTSKSNKLVNDCGLFEKIDSHEKAYWLGILAADGFVGKKAYNVNLSMCDGDTVYSFARFLDVPSKHVRIIEQKKKNYSTVYDLRLQDKRLNISLKNLGIQHNKSLILKPPLFLPKEYQWDYIRGYFDGDGGVSINLKPHRKIQLYFTGTKEICNWLLKKFNKTDLKQPFPENKSNGNNTYRIVITGTNEVYKLYKNIYRNSTTTTRMKRKFKLFETYYTDHPMSKNYELIL